MKTLERPRTVDREATEFRDTPSRWPLAALVAVLALLIGGGLGWLIRGDGRADLVVAGGDEPTARQEQMYDVMRDAEQAWQDGDLDAVVATFTPTGTFETFGTVYRMDDGSFATMFEEGSWGSLDVAAPVLVDDAQMLTFHVFGGRTYTELLTFTTTGDVLIASQVIQD